MNQIVEQHLVTTAHRTAEGLARAEHARQLREVRAARRAQRRTTPAGSPTGSSRAGWTRWSVLRIRFAG